MRSMDPEMVQHPLSCLWHQLTMSQPDSNDFEVGNTVAAELNSLIDDDKCKASKEECAKLVQEALEKVAEDGKFYEQKDADKFEARGVGVLAIPVLLLAYLLNKLANKPEPTKLDVSWNTDDPLSDHKPVAVNIPLDEYNPQDTDTITTTTSAPARDRKST